MTVIVVGPATLIKIAALSKPEKQAKPGHPPSHTTCPSNGPERRWRSAELPSDSLVLAHGNNAVRLGVGGEL